MKTKFPVQVFVFLLLAVSLVACGSRRTKFVAPEIDPPADLIPGYVPEGYHLVSGFRLELGKMSTNFRAESTDGRIYCDQDLSAPFFTPMSPLRNDILGVHYQKDGALLLITKSYFPGGSLDLWQSMYEEVYEQKCDCVCDCLAITIDYPDYPLPLGFVTLEKVHSIGDTQVAVMDSEIIGRVTVFVYDEYLVTVEGDLPVEEHLLIIESLIDD